MADGTHAFISAPHQSPLKWLQGNKKCEPTKLKHTEEEMEAGKGCQPRLETDGLDGWVVTDGQS